MGKGSDKVKPTAQERALAEVNAKNWNRVKQVFHPKEREYVARITDKDRHEGRDKGLAAAGVMQSFQPKAGVDPSSGKGANQITGAGRLAGQGLSESLTSISQGREDLHSEGMKQAIGLGRKIEGQAIGGLSTQARLAQSENIAKARADAYEDEAMGSAIGTAAGLGLSYGMDKWGSGKGGKKKAGGEG